ncbi:MAG: EF-hand domain-containing protein [Proteobacteria bacterium]|nr:EF-hand domain-containing protein [Pseudomonadota bacterium]
MMKRTIVAAVAVALLSAGAAMAQDQGGGKAARGEKFSERFDAADANGDGKLTLEEAQAKMPMVAKHFDEIDVDKKGYVTKAEVAKAMRKMMAERKAQKSEQSGN